MPGLDELLSFHIEFKRKKEIVKSYNIRCKDEKEAEEWGKKFTQVNRDKIDGDLRIIVTPILIQAVVENPPNKK